MVRSAQPPNDVAAYFADVAGRPAWALWGKARPADPGDHPAHPLLCHMIDVAAVAERLVDEVLPRGSVDRLLRPLGSLPSAVARSWLCFVVALHDLGKATPGFQRKWEPATPFLSDLGLPCGAGRAPRLHGIIGVCLAAEALVGLGTERPTARRLARAVGAHHGTFPSDVDLAVPAVSRAELGEGAGWGDARAAIVAALVDLFGLPGAPTPDVSAGDWAFFSALAGLTAVADWVGSMADVFRYEPAPTDARIYLDQARERAARALACVGFRRPSCAGATSFEALFGFVPRPLQSAIADVVRGRSTPVCIVVEAPMGEGKTEAALFAAHALSATGLHDGAYVGLPTQATANQMFDRLYAFLAATRPDEVTNLQLLHGEAVFDTRVTRLLSSVDDPRAGSVVCEEWFLGKKRALLAPFGAGTVDQALLGVLRTRHAFVRQLGLAGKTVILDEVHAYDAYTSTILDRLVAWLGALGASVVVLSATLPARRRRQLLSAYAGRPPGEAPAPYPRMTVADGQGDVVVAVEASRPPLKVQIGWTGADDADVGYLAPGALDRGGVVAVLRNTVGRAQGTFRALRAARAQGRLPAETELVLLHARFPADDRRRIEADLVSRLGPRGARPARMVVVGTQVLEQSLDVDFDALVTDLAPVDLVLQRAGRVHRHDRRRPPGMETPHVIVAAPPGAVGDVDLRRVAGVYEPWVVRRSLAALRERSAVDLPGDIEPLVAAVYDVDSDGDACVDPEREAFEEGRSKEERLARRRAWPSPAVRDDPFADMALPLAEDDPDVARMLRADTRLGEAGIELVCLFGTWKQASAHRTTGPQVDLDAPCTTTDVRTFAQRTVRVTHPGLVRLAKELPLPDSWRSVSTLVRRRPVLFGDAPTRIGEYALSLDDDLGLVVGRFDGAPDGVVPARD